MSVGLDPGVVPVRLRARRRIVALGITATLALAVCALVSVPPLLSGQSTGRKINSDNLAIHQIADLRSGLAAWQFFAEPLCHLLQCAREGGPDEDRDSVSTRHLDWDAGDS